MTETETLLYIYVCDVTLDYARNRKLCKCVCRPDMIYAVDWALKANDLSLNVCDVTLDYDRNRNCFKCVQM